MSKNIPFDPTISGFCKRHHVCRQTCVNEYTSGRLRVYQVGRAVRISPEADAEWVKDREAEANAA